MSVVFLTPLSAKKSLKSKVKVTLCERAWPSGFAVPYHFSISMTAGFAFGQKRVFMLYITTFGT